MSILCTLQNINLAFGNNVLFKNAKITISHRDRIGLLGLNGAGKTSLFKILRGVISPDISSPPFMFDKATGKDDEKLKFSVFFVPQELPLEEGDTVTIRDYLFRFYPTLAGYHSQLQKINHELESITDPGPMEALIEKQKSLLEKIEFIDGWNTIQNYNSYLKYFGHYDDSKLVRNLSGGEQKKILLALGLSANSNLILWDEPTNHLDLETIKLLEEELSGTDRTYMLVSHDRYLLSKLTKKIIHIRAGLIETFEGSYSDYLNFLSVKEESRKKLLEKLDNHLRRETAWMRQGIKARGCRSKKRVENFQDLQTTISKVKAEAKRELTLGLKGSTRKTKKLIEFKNLTIGHDQEVLFDNISFSINKGDKIGILGPNGSGKTTLVKHLSDLLPLNNESSSFSNCENISRAPNLKIQYFSQKRTELNPDDTPFNFLGEGIDFVSLPDGRQVHVTTYFESFLFPKENIHRPLHTFSGGERNRLQLAFNLKHAGDLWIFDEPTNDLDLETLQLLETKLTEFKGSLILICHDRAFLSSVTNKIWLIQDKSIEKFEGGYSQVEPYLEALTFENLLLTNTEEIETPTKSEKPTSTPSPQPKGPKERLTNKQKQRIKVIDQEIEKAEEELAQIEKEVKNFDFTQMTEEKSQQFQEISAKQKELEDTLLELYDEQEILGEACL